MLASYYNFKDRNSEKGGEREGEKKISFSWHSPWECRGKEVRSNLSKRERMMTGSLIHSSNQVCEFWSHDVAAEVTSLPSFDGLSALFKSVRDSSGRCIMPTISFEGSTTPNHWIHSNAIHKSSKLPLSAKSRTIPPGQRANCFIINSGKGSWSTNY